MSTTGAVNASATMRERLLSGAAVNVDQVATELAVSKSLLGQIARGLRDEGHEVATDGAGNYQMVPAATNGNGKAPVAKRSARKKPPRKRTTAKRASVKRSGGQNTRTSGRHPAAGTVAPALDAALVVCGLVRGEDGALRVHCREGGRTWAMMVEGVME